MPEIIAPPNVGAANLDAPPPSPPMKPAANLLTSGMGADGGTPQAMALQGLSMVESGIKLLGSVLPGATAAAAEMLVTLRMAVAQAVSQMGMGAGAMGAGQPMPPQVPPAPMGGGQPM